MDRKHFLVLASGGLLAACHKTDAPPQSAPPGGPGPVVTYLTVDLTQELLAVGSSKQDAGGGVFVQRTGPGNAAGAFRHFSLACPHAGCRVVHQPATGEFLCPCHGSAFAPTGAVLAGPAARPLDRFVLTVEGTTLNIKSR